MLFPAWAKRGLLVLSLTLWPLLPAGAQVPPSERQLEDYRGLHQAAFSGDVAAIRTLSSRGEDLEARDGAGRTPLHVAAFASQDDALRALVTAGADVNALEGRFYDAVTIAAVANDVAMLDLALSLGADPGQVTSPYEGTALIAAAHLGHAEVVKSLIAAGAPLDHVNNLGWTALIEAIVLGDGGPRHTAIVAALVKAGANLNIADRQGVRPLTLARRRGYSKIVAILVKAKAKP